MKLISTAIGAGIAAWALSRMLRQANRQKRPAQRQAVTRWEGEGGAIPEVEAAREALIKSRMRDRSAFVPRPYGPLWPISATEPERLATAPVFIGTKAHRSLERGAI